MILMYLISNEVEPLSHIHVNCSLSQFLSFILTNGQIQSLYFQMLILLLKHGKILFHFFSLIISCLLLLSKTSVIRMLDFLQLTTMSCNFSLILLNSLSSTVRLSEFCPLHSAERFHAQSFVTSFYQNRLCYLVLYRFLVLILVFMHFYNKLFMHVV